MVGGVDWGFFAFVDDVVDELFGVVEVSVEGENVGEGVFGGVVE